MRHGPFGARGEEFPGHQRGQLTPETGTGPQEQRGAAKWEPAGYPEKALSQLVSSKAPLSPRPADQDARGLSGPMGLEPRPGSRGLHGPAFVFLLANLNPI